MVRPAVPDPPELTDRLWRGFKGDFAWDVGSNCGQAIIEMSWEFDKIIGFEPDPGSCEYAASHASRMLPAHDVTVHQVAVSDADGFVELAYPAREQKETGQLVTVGTMGMEWEPEDWDRVEKVRVPCVTADTFAGHHGGYPDFVKVDTEGHELKVLRGAHGLLAAGKTDVLLEFHSPGNHAACEALLRQHGYEVTVVRHPHYPPESRMYRQHGWLRAFAPNRDSLRFFRRDNLGNGHAVNAPAPGSGPISSRADDPRVRALLLDAEVSNAAVAREIGVLESSVRRWRQRNGVANVRAHTAERRRPDVPVVQPGRLGPEHRQALHDKLDAVLDTVTADPEQVKGLTVRQWENVMRGSDGEPVVTRLQGIRLDVKVNEVAPDWPLIDRPQVTYKVTAPGEPRPRHPRDRAAVILPDPQIGYRMFDDGTLDPFHDECAIDVAVQVIADLRPDGVICLGDFQDYAEFGHFGQEAAFARTTQHGIDRGHEFLAQVRSSAPDAWVKVMEGNHDRRAEKRICETNAAAWGLRRAADTTGWPVFSVPYLCAFDLLDVEYVGAYPSGMVWLNDRLRCMHGVKVRSSGSTAAAVVKDDDVSTIFGHVHRLELQYLTRHTRHGASTRVACTPGCLCRVDGAVPSAKGSTTLDGRPVTSYENWQQGIAVCHYREGDAPFSIDLVHIDTQAGYVARYNDRVYQPRKRRVR